jgi:hypothetical protein
MSIESQIIKQAENDFLVNMGLAKPVMFFDKNTEVNEKLASVYKDAYSDYAERVLSLQSTPATKEASAPDDEILKKEASMYVQSLYNQHYPSCLMEICQAWEANYNKNTQYSENVF